LRTFHDYSTEVRDRHAPYDDSAIGQRLKEIFTMTISVQNAQILMEKIRSLPTDRIAEVEDFVDFLKERTKTQKTTIGKEPLDFPVDDLGPWPEGLSLSREDMYGDGGR
jgi:hypothetical protein